MVSITLRLATILQPKEGSLLATKVMTKKAWRAPDDHFCHKEVAGVAPKTSTRQKQSVTGQ